jgi:dolichol kinase
MRREDLRPLIHVCTGLVALGMGVFPRWFLIAGAVAGVVVGWVILPLLPLEKRLRRPGEPFLGGLRTYPLAVLGLVLAFPSAPTLAAAAWAIMAAGDAAASVVGRRVPSRKILGRGKATWAGSGALVLVGGLAAWGVARFVEATGGSPHANLTGIGLAAVAGALPDLLSLPIDDNLPIATFAGLALAATHGLL